MFGILLGLSIFIRTYKHHLPKIIKKLWAFLITLKTIISSIWYMFLYYSFNEMQRSASLEKINDTQIVSNVRNCAHKHNFSETTYSLPKRRNKLNIRNIYERYCITIKPKLFKSNSFSDFTPTASDINTDLFKHTNKLLNQIKTVGSVYGSSGDASTNYFAKNKICSPHMSWNNKGKKTKKKPEMAPESYASKFTNDYIHNSQKNILNPNISSCAENSSSCSANESVQRAAAFPFKSTPSGNLKVQSNQVVFQSSTVGVLLADPTQAKVKVKFEGKSADETGDLIDRNYEDKQEIKQQLQFGPREIITANLQVKSPFYNEKNSNLKSSVVREDKGIDLESLGYAMAEPIDWMRVQLPKKQDLFQEFYRRIHNYVNTDAIIHIGHEEFHCHHIVLQIYSSYFDMHPHKELELPITSVTPEAFQTIYEWMIFSGPESNKILKRDNVLDLFCAAQYLAIKDLEDQCWAFIVNENLFTEDTAFALFREARLRAITPVMDLMVPRVMRFFLPLVASRDFLDLEPEEVMTFLKSNYICVTSEIEVLMAGVRWLYGDWPGRRQLTVDIMRCVRFGLISPWQLVDIKRNPDNAEILEIVNEPEVQQMIDDGLAYVIIKYWYGNNSKNYYHWIDVLGLSEPAERNWIGDEMNHVTYKDFLKYLEQFTVPKDQMFQHMAMMQPPRRNDDMAGSLRTVDNDKMEMRRPKLDFPLPATLKGLTMDKDKSFPTMSEFFEHREKNREGIQLPNRSPIQEADVTAQMNQIFQERRKSPEMEHKQKLTEEQRKVYYIEQQKQQQASQQRRCVTNKPSQPLHGCSLENDSDSPVLNTQMYDPPEKDSTEDVDTTNSETSTNTVNTSIGDKNHYMMKRGEKRHSVAACYLAAATAALAGSRCSQNPTSARAQTITSTSRPDPQPRSVAPLPQNNFCSPQISLFNQSKESFAKMNMNKLSTSILGPSNKNYIAEGSLFDWDRETVLVFGGIDPLTPYGVGRNTGKNIYRFDPVTNVWDYVGDLPEPRHHHSVAFLRGRVYLVGGADPRDDDIRGKSVVVSTVWSYEPVTRSWYSESGLSVPRKNFGLVVHRLALYAIGGQDKKGRVLRSVERFDPKTGAWTEVRSMSIARMAVAAAKYREYIWVAGGMTGEKKKPVCKVVECYNSKTNEWTEIHNLRFPRCFGTLFTMNDKLYLVGGAGKISDKDKTASSVGAIDVWNWKEREWKPLTEMSIPRHGHALAYLGTQLIIIGGVTTIYMRALSNVESFCCERNAWIRGVATLPSPLSGHGAVTLPPASLM